MRGRVLVLGIAWLAFACSDTGDPTDPFDSDNHADGTVIATHDAVTAFSTIPSSIFGEIRTGYRFFYGHTSHGSQIISGLNMLEAENATYEVPDFHRVGDDLGHNGDVTWAAATRDFLDANPGAYNVVMWSWCGGVSDNTEAGIQTYLDTMSQLEADYPNVTFIYMTGHLDGTGANGTLRARDNQIRAYAAANGKVLFDFADIESYDPDGNFFPDEDDECDWCSDWCSSHSCPACGSCAHSHCFNCYLKGKAFWWLMARVAGWEP